MSKTKQRYKRPFVPQVESELPRGVDLEVGMGTQSKAQLYATFKKRTKYEKPRTQRLSITTLNPSIRITRSSVFSDSRTGREKYSLLSYIDSIRQVQGIIGRLKQGYLQLIGETNLSKSEDNFASENEELDITLARLQALLEEEGEDDYGVVKPSAYAYGTALALVSEADRLMSERFTRASASTDDRGGIRLTWTRPKAEVRLVCAHQSDEPTYLYHEMGDEYGIEHDLSASTLAQWLDWLKHV